MNGSEKRQAPTPKDISDFRERLEKIQRMKGYYFNDDDSYTVPLLEQLLNTRARYGYMACPCRYANGSYELDKDIICPCAYRAADIEEYGACFCSLYVTVQWNEGKIPHVYVPDRRPPDKIKF